MASSKVVIAGWFTVDPSKRDEVVDSFKDLVVRAREAKGCLDLAITADPVDPARINNFELWVSESHLNSWRKIANPPENITPMLQVDVQKHMIDRSGPPFG
ncbi:putative quinol monooxygenase [Gilvimarinus sp. F26214L]|uniref:putative quinol monooxygenase n=1 Tax=Gilvimarinus sp. DZF01 TaxID=3461371 RepID=UPI004045D145